MKNCIIFILLLSLLSFSCTGEAEESSYDEERFIRLAYLQHFDTLISCGSFSVTGVSYDGGPSESVLAFKAIFESIDPGVQFKKIFNNAKNIEAKVYALCGLYFYDFDFFTQGVESLSTSGENVSTLSGCLGYSESIGKTIQNLINGNYPKQLREYINAWDVRDKYEKYLKQFAIPGLLDEKQKSTGYLLRNN